MSGIIIRKVFSRATELRGDTVNLLDYYRDTIDNNRFVVYNGIKICDIEKDRCVAMLDMTENSENFNGVAHGGVLFTMGDVCAGMTARSDLRKYVTINADVHFLKPAKRGSRLTCVGAVVNRGRRTCLLNIDITDGEGTLVFTGRYTFYCVSE